MGPNLYRHDAKRTRTLVLAKENLNNKAKARILLPLTSTPLLSRKTKTRIRIRKTYLTLSATFVSKKVIMPTSVPKGAKKLAPVSTTSTMVTKNSEEIIFISAKELEQVMCIQYPITFLGSVTLDGSALDPMSALFNLNNEVNIMPLAFIEKLGLVV